MLKKRFNFFILVLILTGGPISQNGYAKGGGFPFTGVITANKVNVRAGYNTNFEIMTQLHNGQRVMVYDQNYNWYRISLPPEAHCYISKKYLKEIDQEMVVSARTVNVRARPKLTASILGKVYAGDSITVLAEEGEWYKITPPNGINGWVSAEYITYYATPPLPGDQARPLPKPEIMQSSLRMQPSVHRLVPEQAKTYDGIIPVSVHPKQTFLDAPSSDIMHATADEKKQPLARGFVHEMGHFFSRKGTHKLLDRTGATLYYLKSPTIDLDMFIYYKVALWGDVLFPEKSDYPVIIVYAVEPEKGL